jgi:hypothetical protein
MHTCTVRWARPHSGQVLAPIGPVRWGLDQHNLGLSLNLFWLFLELFYDLNRYS